MSTRDELYQAVLDQPDRDGPRLRYAAYLEKQGDELGEFIRLALDWNRQRPHHGPPDRPLNLYNKYIHVLRIPIDPWIVNCQLDRGLVAKVDMDGKAFVDHGHDVFIRAPIQHLNLVNAKPVFSEIMNSKVLLQVQTLSMAKNQLTDLEAELLAASPNVGNLVYLDLFGNRIGEAGFEALTASTILPKLKVLHLDYNKIESPVSRYSSDGYITFYDGVGPIRAVLEKKYGLKAWMEPELNVDRFRMCDAGE